MGSAVAPIFEVSPPQGQFEVVPPKKYLPGRQFGMEVAKGMGLDAEAIKKAEDAGGQGEGLKEIGRQVFEGLSNFVGSVAKDPFNAAKPIEGAATNFENAVKSGSPGQIMGAVSTILGGAQGASKTAEVAGKARGAIGEAIHTPEGTLTSGAKATGMVGGGVLGAAAGTVLGHEPYLSAVAGYKLGPSLLERLFPESEATAAAREEAAGYMQKAEDLMRRGREQEALDRKAATAQRVSDRAAAQAAKNAPKSAAPSPFGNATPTNVSIGDLKLPEPGAVTSATGDLPKGSPTPFVSKFTEAEPSRIVTPLSPAPAVGRTLVSYDRNLLVHMARGGDLNALRELIRNPGGIDVKTAVPNSKYLLEAAP